MTVLWAIAIITYKEGLRSRAVYGIFIISILLLLANFLVSGMITQEVGKVAVDIALSTVSMSGLLLVLFIGINLMAKDLDKRTIYMVLSRPISRSEYIVGKFLGMTVLILAMLAILSAFALISIFAIKIAYPDYFPRFSWLLVLLALSLIVLSIVLLSALSFLFASITSSSFIALVLTVLSYIIGHSLTDVKALVDAPQSVGITVSPIAVKLVHAAYYLLPNLSIFDIKILASHGLVPPSAYLLWAYIYGIGYIALAITMAAFIFRRREFP